MFNTKKKIREIRRKWGKKLMGQNSSDELGLHGEQPVDKENIDPSQKVNSTPNWSLVAGVALVTTIFVGIGAYALGYLPMLSNSSISQPTNSSTAQSSVDLRIKGNRNSHIYHLPGCPNYNDISEQNIVWFRTHEDAKKAGYRMARNC